jgi:uncharacterized DUF497 family protein
MPEKTDMSTKGSQKLQYGMQTDKPITWNADKNLQLMAQRGVCFEDVLVAVAGDGLLANLEHPQPERYGHQRMWVVKMKAYVYLVPYVENEQHIFLKTIIPSRKATRQYLGESHES